MRVSEMLLRAQLAPCLSAWARACRVSTMPQKGSVGTCRADGPRVDGSAAGARGKGGRARGDAAAAEEPS